MKSWICPGGFFIHCAHQWHLECRYC